jgi:hypothetical protein
MKFALVLMTLTRTVELASVRARVKRPHIIALKTRFRPKKSWWVLGWGSCEGRGRDGKMDVLRESRIRQKHSMGRGRGRRRCVRTRSW